jgi:predicted nucleotidyltransferase
VRLPESIAGLDPRLIRDMFATFVDAPTQYDSTGGFPRVVPRKMTADWIAAELDVGNDEGARVHMALIEGGWLDGTKGYPTHRGMALAQHIDRPRISREEAEKILERVVDWATAVNSDTTARVRVKLIELYGSLARGETEVGDIDLIVIYTPDVQEIEPDDYDRQDELTEQLVAISEYISPASELDKIAMPDADYQAIFVA